MARLNLVTGSLVKHIISNISYNVKRILYIEDDLLNKYEKLEQESHDNNVSIFPYDFSGTRLKGLYCNGVIALDKNIETTAERSCILAEEPEHFYTTEGNVLDQRNVNCRKQEFLARFRAYNRQIDLTGIVDGYQHRCQNKHELAEFLDVTVEFLEDAVSCYHSKYGLCVDVDNYVVYFEPALGVVEKF